MKDAGEGGVLRRGPRVKSISPTALRAAHIIPRGFYSVIVSVVAESEREKAKEREKLRVIRRDRV